MVTEEQPYTTTRGWDEQVMVKLRNASRIAWKPEVRGCSHPRNRPGESKRLAVLNL